MRNRLFDSIIQTSGADTDDIHSGEAEGNFWAENELFEAVLREAHLQEMSKLKIEAGITYIKNLVTTGFKSIKEKFAFWLLQGGDEGVLFFDKDNKQIFAEKWFEIILDEIKKSRVTDTTLRNKNITYIQIPAYKERIEIIENQYPIIIKFAREHGWEEGKRFNNAERLKIEREIINDLDLSSII